MSTHDSSQNLINTINNTEIEQVLKYQIFYNIVNISLSMLSHFINVVSVIFSFISVNNDDRYSIGAGILSAVLTVFVSSQQGSPNMINNNNKTINQYIQQS